MPFFGQDPVFYDLLEAQAEAAHKAAQTFQALAQDMSQAARYAEAAKKIESEADNLAHDLVSKADAKFITPLDKGDLHGLSHALDNITDTLEATIARVALYRLTQPRPDLALMTERLTQIATSRTTRPWRRSWSASTNSKTAATRLTGRPWPTCSTGPTPTRCWSSSGRRSTTSSRSPPTSARTSPTFWKA